ncbi:LysM peptidoglycan-binding domain-containing protein [Spirochaeta dissipatitropha]
MRVQTKWILSLLAILFVFLAPNAFSQNLLDNPEIRQSREYERLAEQAIEDGDYAEAIEYSELAAEYARRGQETAERMAMAYRANSLRNRADSRIYYSRRIGVPTQAPDVFTEALEVFADAERYLRDGRYELSMESSQKVLSLLDGFEPRRFVAERPVQPDPEPDLPRYYIVRRIPERRDSFWRIAEYDFVYGDPWLWPRLYERNKDLLVDPENPHLIHPGMQFEIPSRAGELRGGIWNPQDAE